MADSVELIEVGPRDGLQNEVRRVSTELKLDFIRGLIESGLSSIELSSFVSPRAIPQLSDAPNVVSQILNEYPDRVDNFLALVPNLKGLEGARKSGIKHIAVFTATSSTFNKRNINATVEESLKRIQDVIIEAKGLKVRGYVSTVFGCPYEGKKGVSDLAPVVEALLKMGVTEISVGDTIGVALPGQVREVCDYLNSVTSMNRVALHMHDTLGRALTNCYQGLECGVRRFDSSAGGLGGCPYAKGASGNVATEDLVDFFEALGMDTGVDLAKLTQVSAKILSAIDRYGQSKVHQRMLKLAGEK